jgi:hypothetical protein
MLTYWWPMTLNDGFDQRRYSTTTLVQHIDHVDLESWFSKTLNSG